MFLRSISTGLLVAGLFLPTQRDISVRVERVESPAHPVNTLAAGLVVTEIEIERISGKIQTRVLCGEPPFVASALEALKEWRFIVPSEAESAARASRFSLGRRLCIRSRSARRRFVHGTSTRIFLPYLSKSSIQVTRRHLSLQVLPSSKYK